MAGRVFAFQKILFLEKNPAPSVRHINFERTIMFHQNANYLISGTSLPEAEKAMILVHGRGATAQNILELSTYFASPNLAFLAPQASGNSWYPHSFLMPMEQNEPYLTAALGVLKNLINQVIATGIQTENIYLLGFSQGACLSLEFAARHAATYGGVFGLSGGLIGPPGTPRTYEGSLAGTPVFLGCSDVDAHIPKDRVLETAEVMEKMGASVTTKLYPNLPHTMIEDEIKIIQNLMRTQTKPAT